MDPKCADQIRCEGAGHRRRIATKAHRNVVETFIDHLAAKRGLDSETPCFGHEQRAKTSKEVVEGIRFISPHAGYEILLPGDALPLNVLTQHGAPPCSQVLGVSTTHG